MAKLDEAVIGEGDFACECGRTFTHGAWYTKHRLRCDGTKPATSGRIAARDSSAERTPPAAKRPPRRKRSAVKRRKKVHRALAIVESPAPVTGALSPVAFLGAMRDYRAKLDDAIRAVEALA